MVKKRKNTSLGREIKKEIKIERKIQKAEQLGLFMYDIQSNVAFTTFMTAITLFFVGLIITQYDSFNFTIKIPILFLIIATGAFLVSTLIYSNAGGEVSHGRTKNYEKFLFLGNLLSEFFGVYFLMFSIPLTIIATTTDLFLRASTISVISIVFLVYHFSRFSIMERYIKNSYIHALILVIMLIIISFLQSLKSGIFIYLSIILITYILGLLIYSIKGRHIRWWV